MPRSMEHGVCVCAVCSVHGYFKVLFVCALQLHMHGFGKLFEMRAVMEQQKHNDTHIYYYIIE